MTTTSTPNLASDRESWCRLHLQNWKLDGSDPAWGNARCPLHDDSSASLRVNLETGGFICHAASCARTGVLPRLAEEAGLPTNGLPVLEKQPKRERAGRPTQEPLAEYVYQDKEGKNVLCVRRYEPKDFRQFRWEGARWVPGLSGNTPRVPYRLPEILQTDRSVPVWWMEGEKDVLGAQGKARELGPGFWAVEGNGGLPVAEVIDLAVYKNRRSQ